MKRRVLGGLCLAMLWLLAIGSSPRAVPAETPRPLRPVAESDLPALLDIGDAASLREAIILARLSPHPASATRRHRRDHLAPVSRFVMSQDVGGVIRGPGRVDVFWGRGPDAELAASEMKQEGELYVLVPRPPGIRPLPPVRSDPEVAGMTPPLRTLPRS